MSTNAAELQQLETTISKILDKHMNFTNTSSPIAIRKDDAPAKFWHVFVEIYLFCPHITKGEQRNHFKKFFQKSLDKIDERIAGCPIFLNEQSALQYSRFMNDNHVILKAYIPEAAIEGRSQALMLKKGFLTKEHIHGCFPPSNKGLCFYENPAFEVSYQAQARL